MGASKSTRTSAAAEATPPGAARLELHTLRIGGVAAWPAAHSGCGRASEPLGISIGCASTARKRASPAVRLIRAAHAASARAPNAHGATAATVAASHPLLLPPEARTGPRIMECFFMTIFSSCPPEATWLAAPTLASGSSELYSRMELRTHLPDSDRSPSDQPPDPPAPPRSAEHDSSLSLMAQFESEMWFSSMKSCHAWDSSRSRRPSPVYSQVPHSVAKMAAPLARAVETFPRRSAPMEAA
mmetsp:Transcript_89636/g.253676  ORF Transcript_89636/g.253676 Transcript_89636/m.253676 type:complete len:243 (+) Transcript_89636:106-834(+)